MKMIINQRAYTQPSVFGKCFSIVQSVPVFQQDLSVRKPAVECFDLQSFSLLPDFVEESADRLTVKDNKDHYLAA